MKAFKKIVRLGTYEKSNVYCVIEYSAGGQFSISGVVGPLSNGGCRGSAGQINMSLRGRESEIKPAPGWDAVKLITFFELWDRWHLNDMKAGSPAQEQWLRDNPIPEEEYRYPKSHYEIASKRLADAGLNPDSEGYRYGSEWKREEVPEDAMAFFHSLPDADKTPAWV